MHQNVKIIRTFSSPAQCAIVSTPALSGKQGRAHLKRIFQSMHTSDRDEIFGQGCGLSGSRREALQMYTQTQIKKPSASLFSCLKSASTYLGKKKN